MPLKPLRILLCLLWPCFATAQTIPEIAAQVAARISSLLPPRATVSFDFQNLSNLSAAESSAFRSALEAEMKKTGIQTPGTAQPEAQVRVAISQNIHGSMIVGEVRTGERQQTFFLPWTPSPAGAQSPRMKLEQKAVWEQVDPILDFALLSSGSELLVLAPGKLSLYQMADGKWKLSASVALQLARPLPRDPRGRLVTDQTIFHVYLPATTCTGSAQPPLGANCVPGNESWSNMQWASDRNYLEMPGAKDAFYSAAFFENASRPVFAGLDGRIRDQANEPVSGAAGWGSDLAGPITTCASSSIVLATKSGERDASEAVQAHEIVNGSALPVSEPLPLSGPETALWPSEDRDQVSIVVRNTRTGNYEASRLHLACAE